MIKQAIALMLIATAPSLHAMQKKDAAFLWLDFIKNSNNTITSLTYAVTDTELNESTVFYPIKITLKTKLKDAELYIINAIKFIICGKKLLLAGHNTHHIKMMVAQHMQQLHSMLHFATFDINTLEKSMAWFPRTIVQCYEEKSIHRALEKARYYKNFLNKHNFTKDDSFQHGSNFLLMWIDLEMTDVEKPNSGGITEVAGIITDKFLNTLAVLPHLIIHHPDSVINNASPWVKTNIPNSLTNSRRSQLSTQQAEAFLIECIKKIQQPNTLIILAGDCVHTDKLHLSHQMPRFHQILRDETYDVSTLRRSMSWVPALKAYSEQHLKNIKSYSHSAAQDIMETLQEAQLYRSLLTQSISYSQPSTLMNVPMDFQQFHHPSE